MAISGKHTSLYDAPRRQYSWRKSVALPPCLPSLFFPIHAKAVDTAVVAGANGAGLVSVTGDAFLRASGANGSVVLEGGSAILGAAPTVSLFAAREGLSSRGIFGRWFIWYTFDACVILL